MKPYPSTKHFRRDRHQNFRGETFAKYDGSNLRFEWEPKRGWFRFGSRRRLLTAENETFGISWNMFQEQFAAAFERLAIDKRWPGIVAFCEFHGPSSFAGEHVADEAKTLTPIDLAVYKKGLLDAATFVKLFNDQFDLGYLGVCDWTDEFVESVRQSTLTGMTMEGVVGKSGTGHKRLAIKLKSHAWIQQVQSRYGDEKAQKIIES